jgi:hypothetical protein
MPAYPDDQTIRLRAPDRRTPAQLAELARRELARRPAPTLADVQLAPADRALAMFQANYPAAFERAHAGVWWTVAHGLGRPAAGRRARCPDGWCLARAYAKRYGLPAPRVDQLGRLLLGDPGPSCGQALGWRRPAKPKPKAKPRPAGRSRSTAARSSTSTRATAARSWTTARRRRPTPAQLAAATGRGLTAAAAPRLDPATAEYNRRAIARLGLGDPDRWPHLTRAGRR